MKISELEVCTVCVPLEEGTISRGTDGFSKSRKKELGFQESFATVRWT